jgi:hypothetical protein
VRVARNRLGHADDLTHVLDHRLACRHVARGKHAFAMHAGSQHLDWGFMLARQRITWSMMEK